MSNENRLELHEKLCTILGSRNVYFQPPESIKLQYPCIIYSRSRYEKQNADNTAYTVLARYTVTVVYKDPDSDLPIKLLTEFQRITFDRNYKVDNLNHDVFDLYFKN